MTADPETFVQRCIILPDGFVGHADSAWRLGAVLFLRCGSAVAMVQKAAHDPGYEFGNAWSMPGGMVRARDWAADRNTINIPKLVTRSATARTEAEAGILLDYHCEAVPSVLHGPIVSSYTVKDTRKFVLITVQVAQMNECRDLTVQDHSVQNARWMEPPFPWAEIAPANRVLLAHAYWQSLEDRERETARFAIEDGLVKCRAWGRSMGWPLLAAPWDEVTALSAWQEAWTGAGGISIAASD